MLRRGAGADAVHEREKSQGVPERGADAPAKGGPKAAIEKRRPAADPDLAEIEKILKDRGIS